MPVIVSSVLNRAYILPDVNKARPRLVGCAPRPLRPCALQSCARLAGLQARAGRPISASTRPAPALCPNRPALLLRRVARPMLSRVCQGARRAARRSEAPKRRNTPRRQNPSVAPESHPRRRARVRASARLGRALATEKGGPARRLPAGPAPAAVYAAS